MKAINHTINATGINEIRAFLLANHKLSRQIIDGECVEVEYFTPDMLRAWAADAEFQLAEGNPASVEIRSFDSVSGATTTYPVSAAGIDSEEVEIDE